MKKLYATIGTIKKLFAKVTQPKNLYVSTPKEGGIFDNTFDNTFN